MEKPRSYGQACPLATALDVLGERWTLLVVRELLLGPKRFTELGTRLPAAGPNRLSTRLRRLQDVGVVAKTPDGTYALTEYGEGLRVPVVGLGLWGLGLMSGPVDRETARPDMVALCLTGVVTSAQLADIDLVCEVRAGTEVFTMTVIDGRLAVASGPAEGRAPLVMECSAESFIELVLGTFSLSEARRDGKVTVRGRRAGLPRLFAASAAAVRELQPAL